MWLPIASTRQLALLVNLFTSNEEINAASKATMCNFAWHLLVMKFLRQHPNPADLAIAFDRFLHFAHDFFEEEYTTLGRCKS